MSEDQENKESADAYPTEKTQLNTDGDVEKGADVTADHAELDDSKVKFINGGSTPNGGDTVLVVGGKNDQEFAGIGKEELLKYAQDPFWVKVRLALFVLFWLAWFGMLAAAIVIIVLAPKCPPKPNLDWWQTSVAYQIYPRSFMDTDGNGIGDIKGIENKLDYFGKLGVNTLIIGPIYPTENVDFGYDITDHTEINPEMGTMADFDSLLKKAHKKRIKIVLDFIPNHTSDKHKWFLESSMGNSTNKYRDYYVWEKGTASAPPNNWLSKFSKTSAWTKHAKRNEYYYHTFFKEMPELNLRNPDVLKELEDIMAFWLNKGVDGFRIGYASNLVESASFGDEPTNGGSSKKPYDNLDHTMTMNQPESYNLTDRFRAFMDQWYSKDGLDQTRVLLVEAFGDINATNAYMGGEDRNAANLVFNYELFSVDKNCNSRCIAEKVKGSLGSLLPGKWANWMTGNHDSIGRVASRVGVNFVNAMNTLAMTLPGTAITYYGEEIGMNSLDLTFAQTKDKWGKNFGAADYKLVSRDPSRSPMQWTSKMNAGFTNATSWLPLTSTFNEFNVMADEAVGSTHKFTKVYAELTKLRKEPSMLWGQFFDAVLNDNIFSYVRKAEGHPSFLVAINFGIKPSSDDYTSAVKNLVPKEAEVVFNSYNFEHDELAVGEKVKMDNILLKPGEAVIFKYPWQQ